MVCGECLKCTVEVIAILPAERDVGVVPVDAKIQHHYVWSESGEHCAEYL